MNNITFTETAFSQYLYWQAQDKRTLKKLISFCRALIATAHKKKDLIGGKDHDAS